MSISEFACFDAFALRANADVKATRAALTMFSFVALLVGGALGLIMGVLLGIFGKKRGHRWRERYAQSVINAIGDNTQTSTYKYDVLRQYDYEDDIRCEQSSRYNY
jgi:hypothetical protein